MEKYKKIFIISGLVFTVFMFTFISNVSERINFESSSNGIIDNKKIEWGIKREDNHEQPDLGNKNKELINKYNGMALGNKDEKIIYLTFDLGYEGGYTEKILDALKEENVKGAFFITAHYVNTASDIVQRMINEGHIVGNHTPKYLMSENERFKK